MPVVISELKHAHIFNVSTRTKTREAADKDPAGVLDSAVSLAIKPGANFFEGADAEKFDHIKLHPDFLKMVDEGELRVISQDKPGKKGGKETKESKGVPDTLEGIEGRMAVDLVKSTMDAEVLHLWQDEEERETVKVAIRAQLQIVADFDEQRAKAQAEA